MNKRALVGLAVVAAAVVAFFLWRGSTKDDVKTAIDAGLAATETPEVPTTTPRRAPPSVAGAARDPLRLARATAKEVDSPSGRFSGQVINWGSGAPVAGAEVVFRGPAGATSITSDGDGRFVFTPPELGAFGIATVSADGFLPYAPAWGAGRVDLTARSGIEVSGLVIYLTPAIRYRGRVETAAGEAVASAAVKVVSTGSGQFELMPIKDDFVSDNDGHFEFSAPDFSILEATHPEKGFGSAVVDGAVQVSHEMTIKLAPEAAAKKTATLFGVVRDPDGNGVQSLVRASRPDEPNTRAITTDEKGAFELEVTAGATFDVVAAKRGFAAARITASSGKPGSRKEVELTLASSAAVAGKVVSDSGSPVVAFTVIVSLKRGVAETIVATSSFFDAEGQFELGGLAAGEYRVSAAAYGFAPSEPVAAKATTEEPEPVSITLPIGGTLVGRVLDAETKEPLPAARVSVEGNAGGGDSAQPIASSVVTKEDGTFELAGLPPGRASVIAGAYDHHSQIVGGLRVESGATIGPIDIALTPTKDGERPGLELAGIGAQLRSSGDGLEIQRLIDGGGASEAGLVVGDLIVAVDGQKVADLGMNKAIGLIRGPVNTEVDLRVRRTAGEEVDMRVFRRKIRA